MVYVVAGAMAITFANACREQSAGIPDVRERLSDRVEFCRPVTGGYAVIDVRGDRRPFVPVSGRSWVSGFTPDLSGYYWTEVSDGSGDRLRVMVKLEDRRAFEVYGAPWNGADNPMPPRIDWAAKNGASFFVGVASEVAQWSICGGEPRRVWSASHIRAFAFSSRARFVVSEDKPRELRVRPYLETANGEAGDIELPFGPDQLMLGDRETDLVATSHGDSTSNAIAQVMVIDTARGTARKLEIPRSAGKVTSLLPVRGTALILTEIWRGDERADGSELTEFVAWEPSTGNITTLFQNKDAFRIHERPANIVSSPDLCDQR